MPPSSSPPTPPSTPASPSPDPRRHPRYGEARGARKRDRHAAAAKRHAAHLAESAALQAPPETPEDAASRWDAFYRTKPTLYKDRHVLRAVLPDLVSPAVAANPRAHIAPLTPTEPHPAAHSMRDAGGQDARDERPLLLLEACCGTGSALFPLLRANPRLVGLAFDLSATAVDVARSRPEYAAGRAHVFRADAGDAATYVAEAQRRSVDGQGADFVTALWALSALPAATRRRAAHGLASALRPGGTLFVRDFAAGDMRESVFDAQGRRQDGKGRLFMRGDGTYAYFFETAELRALFEHARLECRSCEIECREVHNRKDDVVMHRRWIHAKFVRPAS